MRTSPDDQPGPDLLAGLATTRAIRRYTARPVTDEQLATLLWAATRAPSGSNRQPFRFLVLRRGERAVEARALLGRAAHLMWERKLEADGYRTGSGSDPSSPKSRMARTMEHYTAHVAEAPVVVLGCLVRHRPADPLEGASIYPACQNLLLAARALGLGGVLTQLHTFVEDELRAVLAIPESVGIHATITLGEPAGRHGPVRRRPLGELVFEDGWGEPAPWAVDPPGTRFTQAGPPPGIAPGAPPA
ncbi:MAG: nitroreductase family protein [Actinomycetota bacterium]|jgi:nitroreductase|nr:nitroreductase family protein [Actinomycetota bacterium]